MIADNPGKFRFETRSRRPPRNEVNAALSFTYMLLTHDAQSAMETVGIDPAAGYMHTLRPGRASFALDLIEELRAPLCDRFVIALFRVCFQSHQQAKLCKPEQCSRQMNESEESASELFEAHSDSAMIFDLHEKAFNKMPFFVVIEIGVPWIN